MLDHLEDLNERTFLGLILCFLCFYEEFFIIFFFCNILRINPWLVVQNLARRTCTFQSSQHHFAGGPNIEKIKQFKRLSCCGMIEPCWVSTQQEDFWDLGRNTLVNFLAVYGLRTSKRKTELIACAFLAVELQLSII